MPLTSRPARAIAAACFVVVTWLSAAPLPAAALQPPQPLPNYRPEFVTETDEHPWTDCLWASGSMLLDKWTNGDVTRTHQQLRKLARDHKGGSALADLHVAYARLGIDLRFSPDGGERITWTTLLRRLEKGAGAVLLGDDSRLPRWFGRWDYGFWKLTKDEGKDKDNHAVYIERYDPRHGRVWLMDPLGRPGWKGEWISVRALRRFAWTTGGALTVAVTPTAKEAPFNRVRIASPTISMTSTTVTAAFAIKAPRRWSFPGADVRTTFKAAGDPLLAAATSLPVTTAATATTAAPKKPVAGVRGASLRATSALPAKAGAYWATFALTDRRFGRTVAQTRDFAVFVPGPRRATISLSVRNETIDAGRPVSLKVSVANTGTESWADPVHSAVAEAEQVPVRDTHVVAHWIRMGGSTDGDPPAPVELRAVPLTPGRLATVQVRLVAPDAPGTWALVVDIVDDVDGSFAALGSAPAVQAFTVVATPGVEELQ
jgi:hypothetical protein